MLGAIFHRILLVLTWPRDLPSTLKSLVEPLQSAGASGIGKLGISLELVEAVEEGVHRGTLKRGAVVPLCTL